MRKLKYLLPVIVAVAVTFTSCNKDESPAELNLDAPEGISVNSIFALKVELRWDEVENAESYNILRADFEDTDTPEDLDYSFIDASDENSFDDLSVNSSSSYYYKIQAVNGDTTSEESAPILAQTDEVTADEAFTILAEYTDGRRYDAAVASEVPGIVVNVINEQAVANTDLVFLIDSTGSMEDDIDQVKDALSNILSTLPAGTKIAMAAYNDANEDPAAWYQWFDLTSDYSVAQDFLDNLSVYGGGDIPESVYDGIYLTVDNLSWTTDTKRMMIVLGDAPPLEGSLTQFTLSDVVTICNDNAIVTNIYPILIGGL